MNLRISAESVSSANSTLHRPSVDLSVRPSVRVYHNLSLSLHKEIWQQGCKCKLIRVSLCPLRWGPWVIQDLDLADDAEAAGPGEEQAQHQVPETAHQFFLQQGELVLDSYHLHSLRFLRRDEEPVHLYVPPHPHQHTSVSFSQGRQNSASIVPFIC